MWRWRLPNGWKALGGGWERLRRKRQFPRGEGGLHPCLSNPALGQGRAAVHNPPAYQPPIRCTDGRCRNPLVRKKKLDKRRQREGVCQVQKSTLISFFAVCFLGEVLHAVTTCQMTIPPLCGAAHGAPTQAFAMDPAPQRTCDAALPPSVFSPGEAYCRPPQPLPATSGLARGMLGVWLRRAA